MIHRESGVLKTTYEADMALYPLPIAKYTVAALAVLFFGVIPLSLHEYYLSIANLVWIAVIGARWRLLSRGLDTPALVVMVGTAVTVDALDASGRFLGGFILPGHGIMLRSMWDVHGALRGGELVQVLPGWGVRDADVQWVLPPRPADSPLPRRLQLLQGHLAAALRKAPWNKPAA